MCSTSNSFAVLEFNDDFDFMLYGFKSTNANQYSPVGVIHKRSCTVCSSHYDHHFSKVHTALRAVSRQAYMRGQREM